ncbi:MAG: S24 family peptidase [Gammaproteobacteria bacterium]|nr:S24 family peptidase [Gammaproteobacteria bacterium]
MSDDIKQQVEAQLAAGSCSANEPLALQVIGDSMEPEFKNGNIIIIDRDAAIRDKSYVIALVEGGYTLRQLFIENERYFVEPLNPDYKHERQEITMDALMGVVVQQNDPKGKRKDRKFYNQIKH